MKKFLTVLLALSVVFTYTVGTAFAATTVSASDTQTDIETVQKAVSDIISEYAAKKISYNNNDILTDVDSLNGGVTEHAGNYMTKAAVKVGVAKYVKEKLENIKNDENFGVIDFDEMLSFYEGYFSDTQIANELFDGVYLNAMFNKAISDKVAEAEAAIDAFDLADYSDATATVLRAEMEDLGEMIYAPKADKKTYLDNLASQLETFKEETKDLSTAAKDSEELEKDKAELVRHISELADNFTSLERTRLETKIAANTDKAACELKLSALENNVAALVAFYCDKVAAIIIDDETTALEAKTALGSIRTGVESVFGDPSGNNGVFFYGAVANLKNVDLLVAFAEGYAKQLKEKYDVDTGLAVYNDATVDKKLAEVIVEIKNYTLNSEANIKAALDATKTAATELVELKTERAEAAGAIESYDGVDNSGWKDERADAVDAIKDEYIAKIKVATSHEDIDQLKKDAKKAMDAYLTVTQMGTVETNTANAMRTLGYNLKLRAYANAIVGKNVGAYSAAVITATVDAARDLLVDAVLAENNVDLTQTQIRTILEGNYDKALALIDGIKTDAEIEASAAALVAAIDALPETVTLADKAQYLDVQTMAENYIAVPGATFVAVTNFGDLRTDMRTLVQLERNAVEGLIRALPTTITVDNKDAVEAARAAYDAYRAAYKGYADETNTDGFTYGYADPLNKTVLEAKETALRNAMMLDAAKKIADLPAVITLADKGAVEAAKAAYDALYATDKALFDIASKALVEKLEAALDTLAKLEKEHAIAAVESMKVVKAHSAAGKGYIKVMWDVVGDETAIDGFQVYKSTKAQTEYTFMGKTTKHYMTNKKNLKKGKRYFYRVRAYADIDGVRYFSDWSNKANRIAK